MKGVKFIVGVFLVIPLVVGVVNAEGEDLERWEERKSEMMKHLCDKYPTHLSCLKGSETRLHIQGCDGAEMSSDNRQITCADGRVYRLDNSANQIPRAIFKPKVEWDNYVEESGGASTVDQ